MQWFIIYPFHKILMRSFPADTHFPILVLKLTLTRRKQFLICPGFSSYLSPFELHLIDSLTVWDLVFHCLQWEDSSLIFFLFFLWWILVRLRRDFLFLFRNFNNCAIPPDVYYSVRLVKCCWSLGFLKRNLWHNFSFQYTNPYAEYPSLMHTNQHLYWPH